MNSYVWNNASLPSQSLFCTSGFSGNLFVFPSLASQYILPPHSHPWAASLDCTPNSKVPFCLHFLLRLFHSPSCTFTKDTCTASPAPLPSPHGSVITFLGTPNCYSPPNSHASNSYSLPILRKSGSSLPLFSSMCSPFQPPATSVLVFSTLKWISTVDKQGTDTRKLWVCTTSHCLELYLLAKSCCAHKIFQH